MRATFCGIEIVRVMLLEAESTVLAVLDSKSRLSR